MNSSALILQILASAQAAGLHQKALAEKTGIKEETISRIKKRGTGHFDIIAKLAQAAGSPLCLGSSVQAPRFAVKPKSFRDKYAVQLAWSNKRAPDEMLIRRALVKPGFVLLLDAAIEFGLEHLLTVWAQLVAEGSEEVMQAAPVTGRILQHIQHGYQQATR